MWPYIWIGFSKIYYFITLSKNCVIFFELIQFKNIYVEWYSINNYFTVIIWFGRKLWKLFDLLIFLWRYKIHLTKETRKIICYLWYIFKQKTCYFLYLSNLMGIPWRRNTSIWRFIKHNENCCYWCGVCNIAGACNKHGRDSWSSL